MEFCPEISLEQGRHFHPLGKFFGADVKTHITSLSGTLFKPITGELVARGIEYSTESVNKLHQRHLQAENLFEKVKEYNFNVLKNFNKTIKISNELFISEINKIYPTI